MPMATVHCTVYIIIHGYATAQLDPYGMAYISLAIVYVT